MPQHDQLIDAPLEAPSVNKRSKLRNRLDFGLNALLIGAIVLCLLGAVVDTSSLFIAAVLFFFLGAYQFISAIAGSVNGNTQKQRYLAVISIYLLLLFIGFTVGDQLQARGDASFLLAMLGLFILPALGALYYLNLCYQVMKLEKYNYD